MDNHFEIKGVLGYIDLMISLNILYIGVLFHNHLRTSFRSPNKSPPLAAQCIGFLIFEHETLKWLLGNSKVENISVPCSPSEPIE